MIVQLPRRLRRGAGFAVLCCGIAGSTSAHDVVPPLQAASPRLRFHAGGVDNGHPAILTALPAIPGRASDWYVAQWQQESYLRPEMLTARDAAGSWRFETPDKHSLLQIDEQQSGRVYTLSERDGILTSAGGANLFLATEAVGNNSFANPMILSLAYRLTDAATTASDPAAIASGAVQAMAFVGLGLQFYDHSGHLARFVFMQLPITVSRPLLRGPMIICKLTDGHPSLLYTPELQPSIFKVEATSQHRSYDISSLVRTMLSHPYPCGGKMLDWPEEQRNPAAWRLSGTYVGLEVQNRDLRPAATSNVSQGHAALGLQLSNLSIVN